MGTAVLSPQDCLAPHHSRHDQALTGMIYPSAGNVPKSRRALQQSVQSVLPSLVSECSSRNFLRSSSVVTTTAGEGFSNVDECQGLLPVPANQFSPSHVPTASICSPAPLLSGSLFPGKTYANVPTLSLSPSPVIHARSQFIPSRSLSAGPTTQSSHTINGASPSGERLSSSTGRYNFRSAQENCVGNKVGRGMGFGTMPESSHLLRFSDPSRSRNIPDDTLRKKLSSGEDYVGDLRKRTQGDFRKGILEGGSLFKSPQRDLETKKNGKKKLNDKAITGNNPDAASLPGTLLRPNSAVTILRRPKTKEAAVELLAKFGWKVEASAIKKEGVDCSETSKGDRFALTELVEGSECTGNSFSKNGVYMQAGINVGNGNLLTNPGKEIFFETLASASKEGTVELYKSGLQKANNEALGVSTEASPCKNEMQVDGDLKDVCCFAPAVPPNERWAGPAYSNSPPPSSLPFPRFSKRQLRTSSLDALSGRSHSSADLPLSGIVSVPNSPPRQCDVPGHGLSSCENLKENGMDVAFATRNLRRILNLDSC